MAKYKTDFFKFIDKNFFTRPKIGFIFIFSSICLLGNRDVWFSSWYNGLFKDKNILYLIPLCLIATTLGRLIEKLNIIKATDTIITKLGIKVDGLLQKIKVNNIQYSISSEMIDLLNKYPKEFASILVCSLPKTSTIFFFKGKLINDVISDQWIFCAVRLKNNHRLYLLCGLKKTTNLFKSSNEVLKTDINSNIDFKLNQENKFLYNDFKEMIANISNVFFATHYIEEISVEDFFPKTFGKPFLENRYLIEGSAEDKNIFEKYNISPENIDKIFVGRILHNYQILFGILKKINEDILIKKQCTEFYQIYNILINKK